MTELSDAALRYARDGLPIFPLPPRGKTPATKHGFHDATTDIDQITAYWRRHPNANIGIRPPTGVIVVDVDPRNGGERELAHLLRRRGLLPPTWTARTGSGGAHYWFTTDPVEQIRGHIGDGIDIKHGAAGYVVAPPSVHPNGNTYEWLIPPNGTPAKAPLWLRLAIQPSPPARRWLHTIVGGAAGTDGQYSLQCLVARINTAPQGRRNRTVYGAMKDALRQGDLDTFETDLAAAALATGLTSTEVDAIIRSVRRGSPA